MNDLPYSKSIASLDFGSALNSEGRFCDTWHTTKNDFEESEYERRAAVSLIKSSLRPEAVAAASDVMLV